MGGPGALVEGTAGGALFTVGTEAALVEAGSAGLPFGAVGASVTLGFAGLLPSKTGMGGFRWPDKPGLAVNSLSAL